MCGIAGIITSENSGLRLPLERMLGAQAHRGPDDSGITVSDFGRGQVGLGHRRLSVLDLSAAGHQPMIHAESGDQLVFNGQIYNFRALRSELESNGVRFRGHSDTEVLLHALHRWGTGTFRRLQGMYALAWFMAREQRIVLARDPLGIKPLYVGQHAGSLVFASEVRAILASRLVPSTLDPEGVAGMLAYGSVQHPLTLFRHIHSIPAGCHQEITADGCMTIQPPVRFWSAARIQPELTPAVAVDSIRQTLETSVQDHLVADVPVGVFLSSGIDSTIVAGLAVQHQPNLRSFTVGFGDQPDLSEFPLAQATARQLGLQHTEITINNHDAEEATSTWLKTLDQPSMDGLNTFIISRAVRQQGIVVALSGLGGDELFGGYPSFIDVPRLLRMTRPLRRLPPSMRSLLGTLLTAGKPSGTRDKLQDILRGQANVLGLYLQRRRLMSNRQMTELGMQPDTTDSEGHFLSDDSIAELTIDEDNPIWTLSQLESRLYMGNTLLRDSDTNAMAHGLELRVPLLGQQVVDLMGRVPDAVRLPQANANKHLLRNAFGHLLPAAVLDQRKRGFSLPIGRWMRGPLRDQCEHALGTLKSSGLLHATGIDAVWQSFLAQPETAIWSRAFALVVLGHYLEETSALT